MKKNKLLITLGIGVLAATATGLTSCGNSNDEYVIWAWNKNVDALNAGISSYKKNVNPNFKARVESFARLDIDKKFKTASQTNNKKAVGDIVLCDGQNIRQYYDIWSGIFTDISDKVTAEELGTLVPSTIKTARPDNKLIGLPLDSPANVCFANTTLWAEEDLAKVRTSGWTWDEYLEIGKKIKAAKGNDVVMTSYNMRGDDRIYRIMSSQKGEWFMDENYNVQIGNENSIAAMTRIKNHYDEGVLGHIDTGDYKSLMKNNKVAAELQGFWLGGQLKDVAPEMAGKWEVLPLPKWDANDESSGSITGGSYLYANSKLSGDRLDEAVSFIKWMTLNSDTAIQSLKEAGVFPALATAYQDEYFTSAHDDYYVNQNVWTDVAKFSSGAKPIVATKYNAFNMDKFNAAQEKIIFTTNYESIEKVLQDLANEMRENAR